MPSNAVDQDDFPAWESHAILNRTRGSSPAAFKSEGQIGCANALMQEAAQLDAGMCHHGYDRHAFQLTVMLVQGGYIEQWACSARAMIENGHAALVAQRLAMFQESRWQQLAAIALHALAEECPSTAVSFNSHPT
jgi:hypothetical protein